MQIDITALICAALGIVASITVAAIQSLLTSIGGLPELKEETDNGIGYHIRNAVVKGWITA